MYKVYYRRGLDIVLIDRRTTQTGAENRAKAYGAHMHNTTSNDYVTFIICVNSDAVIAQYLNGK